MILERMYVAIVSIASVMHNDTGANVRSYIASIASVMHNDTGANVRSYSVNSISYAHNCDPCLIPAEYLGHQ